MTKFLDWTIRLLYIWFIRLFSEEKAEGEIRKWNGELEMAMWGPQTRKRVGVSEMPGPPMAHKVQQMMEWDTAIYETDPVSGQSQLHDRPTTDQTAKTVKA